MNYQHSSAVSITPKPKYKIAMNTIFVLILVGLIGTTVVNLFNSSGYQRGYKPVETLPSVEELREERIEALPVPVETPPTVKNAPLPPSTTPISSVPVQDLQPMATKISENITVSPEQISLFPESSDIYDEFWASFEAQAGRTSDYNKNGRVEPLELAKSKQSFLSNLGYVVDPASRMIYVKGSNVQVSPETLMCYFNGMVPTRGYIKPNCPPN